MLLKKSELYCMSAKLMTLCAQVYSQTWSLLECKINNKAINYNAQCIYTF